MPFWNRRKEPYNKSIVTAEQEEIKFKETHGIPVDAYGLPQVVALYDQTMKGIWPQLCKVDRAQSRYLKIIHEALKNVDKKFADIYVVEPDLNCSTGSPSGSAKIYAKISEPMEKPKNEKEIMKQEEEKKKQEALKQQEINNASDLAKIMLLTYKSLMDYYVLAGKGMDDSTIRTVYREVKVRVKEEAKKSEERPDSSPTSIG
jgi:hypothetical protein